VLHFATCVLPRVKIRRINTGVNKIYSKYLDARGKARKIVEAVAVGVVDKKVLKYAQSKGLYAVVQSGEAVEIAYTSKSFKAREGCAFFYGKDIETA